MAKTAKASADAANTKATGASQEAQLAKTLANGASQEAQEAKQLAETALAEAKKRTGGGTTTVVRTSSGSGGHDVTARLANWRLAVGMFLAGGDDLATAKTKATQFVTDPKGNENELWKAAATIREKVREIGLDLYATKTDLEAEAKARAEKDRSLELQIPDVTKIASTIATALKADGFVTKEQLDTKADKGEVEGLLTDVKNISEELSSAKADAAKMEEILSQLRKEYGQNFYWIALALEELSQPENEKVVNKPLISSLTGLLGRDEKVKTEPATKEARLKAASMAAAVAAKYAEYK